MEMDNSSDTAENENQSTLTPAGDELIHKESYIACEGEKVVG
jgi:hypothetical protein